MARNNNNKDYPSEEQGILPEETPEEEELEMESGEKEADVYTEEGREELAENDELEPFEEGFMEGEEKGGKDAKCASCGKVLSQNKTKVIEREIDGEICFFCSEKCAKKGLKKPE